MRVRMLEDDLMDVSHAEPWWKKGDIIEAIEDLPRQTFVLKFSDATCEVDQRLAEVVEP